MSALLLGYAVFMHSFHADEVRECRETGEHAEARVTELETTLERAREAWTKDGNALRDSLMVTTTKIERSLREPQAQAIARLEAGLARMEEVVRRYNREVWIVTTPDADRWREILTSIRRLEQVKQ